MERSWALREFTQHELVYLGFIVGLFRGCYGSARKGWRERDQFQSGTAIRTVVILVFAWGVAMFTHTQPLSAISRRTWIFLILSGLATGLSWLCYFRALQLGEASRVAPVDKLSVVVAIALAVMFLHEPLTWHHWVGGLFIFSGAVVLAYA